MEAIIELILGWISKGARQSATDERGQKMLCYGKELKIVGAVVTIFWIALVTLVFMGVFNGTQEDALWCVALFACLMFTGVAMLIEAYLVRIAYDETAITAYSPWRRDIRMIPWSDIESVRYSGTMRWYVCKTKNHGNLILSSYLMGLGDFLEEMEERAD